MTKVLSLFTLIILSYANLLGADYRSMTTFSKKWRKSNRTEFLNGNLKLGELQKFDSIYINTPSEYHFFYNEEKLQAYLGCGLDLYEIKNNSLNLQYKYFNRGYTCVTTPLVRESQNYLLGGYGYWTYHMDILKLDKVHGSWELVPTKNQPIDYQSSGIYQNSKGIFSLFGVRLNVRKDLEEIETNGYFLDWETKEWKKIDLMIEGVDNGELLKKKQPKFLETQDYLFMVFTEDFKNVGWNIIDKESGKIFLFDNLKNEDVFLSPFVEVIGNQINFESPDGQSKSLDINKLFSESKPVGQIKVLDSNSGNKSIMPLKDGIYIVIIVLLILLVTKQYIQNTTLLKSNIPNLPNELENVVQAFSQYSGQLLNTDQLDEILGINQLINMDSKRLKRSRWISRLNEYHNIKKGIDLIERDKNPEDKRFLYYRIN